MSECIDCERHKKSAALWRNKAYELVGNPLSWEPEEIWVGLTDEERFLNECRTEEEIKYARAIESKLKEKNTNVLLIIGVLND